MPEQEYNLLPSSVTGENKPQQMGMVRFSSGTVNVFESEAGLLIQVERGETVIDAHFISRVVFDAAVAGLAVQEAALVPELPIIRIEGNLGRAPDFRTGKEKEHRGQPELYMRLAYHPNPTNREETTWYDVYLWGDAAKAGRALDLRGGQPVQMVGRHKQYTRMVKPRGGGDPVEREFHELYVTSPDDILKLRRLPRTLEETQQPK